MTKQENTQNLIGRKFKGFEFESTGEIGYYKEMDEFVDKELCIIGITKNFYVQSNELYSYPLHAVLKHLIPEEEEIKITYAKDDVIKIIDELLLMPDILIDAVQNENTNYNGESLLRIVEQKATPIQRYTLQELKEKLGHDFELIE